jgi:uncharacterized repeat protein (TIGR03803 family)
MRDELRHLGRTYLPGGGNGTILELTSSGGVWTKRMIYSGAPGYAGLAIDAAGNIFGVATDIVFELSPNGQGGWNPTVIHTFSGGPTDGLVGEGTLVLDHAGNLYGTTLEGGSKNDGTVYELSRGANGWREKILHSFVGGSNDGSEPVAGIVLDSAGNIYDITEVAGNPLSAYRCFGVGFSPLRFTVPGGILKLTNKVTLGEFW